MELFFRFMPPLHPGDKAPDFSAVDHNGFLVSLKELEGSRIILYFYPKDNTPGCTAEACDFRDNYQVLTKMGFKVIGVSADDEKSHKIFSEKYVLPFTLIPDKEKKIIREFGAWGRKKLYGREYEGIIRMTFLIDGHGIISHIIPKVDTRHPVNQILELTGYQSNK